MDSGHSIYSHNQLYGRWYIVDAEKFPKTKRSLRLALKTKTHSALLFSASEIDVLEKSEIDNHPFLNRFKQCFLTNINTNYTGEGVYSTYEDGTPVSIIMTLSFKELAPIYDIDYDSYTTGEGDERKDFKSPGGVGY